MTDQLGPDFDQRLRADLERFDGPTPLPESARFNAPLPPRRRLSPVKPALALAALAVLLVAASALAGGPDPSTWTQKAVSSFESVTHLQPAPSPASVSSPQMHSRPTSHTAPRPQRESPEPSEGSNAEPPDTPSTSPSSDSGHHDSAGSSPSPSPGPEDGDHQSPSPSPSGSHS